MDGLLSWLRTRFDFRNKRSACWVLSSDCAVLGKVRRSGHAAARNVFDDVSFVPQDEAADDEDDGENEEEDEEEEGDDDDEEEDGEEAPPKKKAPSSATKEPAAKKQKVRWRCGTLLHVGAAKFC